MTTARMPQPDAIDAWTAPADGVVTAMDAELVGRAAVALGAGRDRADAAVDPAAGIDMLAPVGTAVRRGDPVVRAGVSRRRAGCRRAKALLAQAIRIGDVLAPPASPVIDRIDRTRGRTPN